MVSIDDGYNRANNKEVKDSEGESKTPKEYMDDVTIKIDVTINVTPKPDQETPSLSVNADENTTGEVLGALSDLGAAFPSNAALGRLITVVNGVMAPDKVTFKHTGGTNNGRPVPSDSTSTADFSVDSATGAVMLDVAQDFETDGEEHTLHISVERDSDRATLGLIVLEVNINDVNEAPSFADATATAWVSENAVINSAVKVSSMDGAADFMPMATDEDDDTLTYTTDSALFGVMGGKLVVTGMLDADSGVTSHVVVVTASDGTLEDTQTVTIAIGDANDRPGLC